LAWALGFSPGGAKKEVGEDGKVEVAFPLGPIFDEFFELGTFFQNFLEGVLATAEVSGPYADSFGFSKPPFFV
jgi:hypothetical protein